jgi:hypothetical protein
MVQRVVPPFSPLSLRHESLEAWGLLVLPIMEAILGFFSRQDEDLPDACHHQSGGSVMFWKAPLVYSTRRFMPGEIAGSDGDSIMRIHIFYLTLVFEGALRTSASCYHHVA